MIPQMPFVFLQQTCRKDSQEGKFHPECLICETPSVSICSYYSKSLASEELLEHLVEESPGHFRTKGKICSLLKTKPHRIYP